MSETNVLPTQEELGNMGRLECRRLAKRLEIPADVINTKETTDDYRQMILDWISEHGGENGEAKADKKKASKAASKPKGHSKAASADKKTDLEAIEGGMPDGISLKSLSAKVDKLAEVVEKLVDNVTKLGDVINSQNEASADDLLELKKETWKIHELVMHHGLWAENSENFNLDEAPSGLDFDGKLRHLEEQLKEGND